MRALIVYESMFGNTRQIAEAVATGTSAWADVTICGVDDAPGDVALDLDMLVVGGPTHVFSMSRGATRWEAVHRQGLVTDVAVGIREWLQALAEIDRSTFFAAFDTRVDLHLFPGAASHGATRVARARGFITTPPESFYVADYEGPLLNGEIDRARRWGERLSDRVLKTDTTILE